MSTIRSSAILFLSFTLLVIGMVLFTVGSGVSLLSAAPLSEPTRVFLPAVHNDQSVQPVPVILSFTAAPTTISPGGASVLSWVVTGASSLAISPGIGAVTGSSITVQPATRTEYTLTASNASGAATAHVTVDLRSGGGGGEGEGGVWLPYRLSSGAILPTYGASIAVDASGGVHAAYGLLSSSNEAEGGYSTYAYCAASCTESENWRFLNLGESSEIRLQLDPSGSPRLLLAVPGDTVSEYQSVRYQYGVCNTNCTQAASWTFTTVAEVLDSIAWVGGRENENNHYFALDAQGRPAFLYTRFEQDDPYMGFLDYTVCVVANPAGCSQAANWTSTSLAHTNFPKKPSFVFAGTGQPRLALRVSNGLESSLWYAQCDQGCTSADHWSWTRITATSYYETMVFSLRLDGSGRPRIALYSGAYNQHPSPFTDDRLYYLWCNEGCANGEASNWHGTDIGLPALSGHDVDLALDGEDRPRLVYSDSNQGLGYSWCNQNCESTQAQWQHATAESSQSLSNDYEVLPIRRCTVSTWFTGVRPTLALDAQGNLRIAYDAQHYWYGTETVGGQVKPCNFKDINVTRFRAVVRPE
jgi:hypothetical protein